jgi:long-chain fatty acid transport protein
MKSFNKIAILGILAITFGAFAFGSGFAIYEHGARAMGQAGAFVARANDPSAIWFNPAGMTQLPGTQIYGGGTAIIHSSTFFSEGAGLTIESDDEIGFPPNFFITHQLTDNIWIGAGFNAPFGLSKTWPLPSSTDPLVYHTQYAKLQLLFFSGALAVKVSDCFSIGAGVSYVSASVLWERYMNIDTLVASLSHGLISDVEDLYFKADVTGNAMSYFGGIQWKISPTITFGASYHSGANIEYTGDILMQEPATASSTINAYLASFFPDSPDQGGTASLPFVDNIMGGFAFKLSEALDIECDAYYTLWSKYEQLTLDFDINTFVPAVTPIPVVADQVIPKNWEDTLCVRLGGEYHASPALDVRFGILYDQNPIPDATLDPMLPDNDRIGMSAGIGYHKNGLVVDFAYMLLLLGERKPVGNTILTPLDQNYEATQAHLIGLSVGYTL